MLRFCPTLSTKPLILFLAAMSASCTGGSIEGAWYGPMPWLPESGECRVRLMSTHRYDFACRGPKAWSGVGSYTNAREGGTPTLRLKYDVVQLDGQPRSEELTVPTLGFVQNGNELTLTYGSDTLTWRRRMR